MPARRYRETARASGSGSAAQVCQTEGENQAGRAAAPDGFRTGQVDFHTGQVGGGLDWLDRDRDCLPVGYMGFWAVVGS